MGQTTASESTSESGSGQRWLRGDVRRGINQVNSSFGRYDPYTQRGVEQTERVGNALGAQYDAGSATAAQGQQYWGDILSGRYMNSNPYLDNMAAQSRRNVADSVNSQFSLGGRYGSDAHAGALTREMANAENNLRFNDYNQQMGRMDQAAAAASGQNNAQASLALGAQNQQMTAPYAGMSAYAGALGNLFNGGSSRSVTYAPNPLLGMAGTALSGAGMLAFGSDRRMKKGIVKIGALPNGLNVYDFRYKHDPEQATYRGVMADEVKDRVPDAYIENFDGRGHAGVNYALVGMPMMKVA